MTAIDELLAVVNEVIEEAEPVYREHHEEPDEMVLQVETVDRLRSALVAAEQLVASLDGNDE